MCIHPMLPSTFSHQHPTMRKTLLATAALLSALSSNAAITVGSSNFTYTQSFNTLVAAGTNNVWANDTTLLGWHGFAQPLTGTAITAYNADAGTSTTGSFVSYGSSGSSERALGGLASGGTYFGSPVSGAVAGWIAVSFTNATGTTLAGFNLGFDGEQWRNGGNATAQSMVLQHGFGGSFAAVTNWITPGGSFNFTSPLASTTAAAVDGNVAGRSPGSAAASAHPGQLATRCGCAGSKTTTLAATMAWPSTTSTSA